MQCQYCGFENLPGITECINCNNPVIRKISKFTIAPHLHPIRRRLDQIIYGFKLRFQRDEDIEQAAEYAEGVPVEESFWLAIRFALNPQVGKSLWYHNPWIAALLTILPGLGQIYKGELRKGIIYFLLWLIVLSIAFLSVGTFWGTFAWSTVLAIYAAAILDAITANIITLSRGETFLWNVGILIIIFLIFTYGVVPYFRAILIQENNNLSPYFEKNDRLLISNLPYKFRDPEVGEIVYYSIPTEKINYSGQEVTTVAGDVIERIIGISGDKFKLKNMQLWRNDVLLPMNLYPLNIVGIMKDTKSEFTVPENCYFIYLSCPFNREVDVGKRLAASIVSKANIQGKVILRYSPSNRWMAF